ncbi:hypothetical protein ACWDRB_14100 [Nonomuraea sp. NPDC003707]
MVWLGAWLRGPRGGGEALVAALGEGHGTVRRAAATGLRELAEVLRQPSLGVALTGCLTGADAVVRAAALDVLRLGGQAAFGPSRSTCCARCRSATGRRSGYCA